jgi:hypothetical protein
MRQELKGMGSVATNGRANWMWIPSISAFPVANRSADVCMHQSESSRVTVFCMSRMDSNVFGMMLSRVWVILLQSTESICKHWLLARPRDVAWLLWGLWPVRGVLLLGIFLETPVCLPSSPYTVSSPNIIVPFWVTSLGWFQGIWARQALQSAN